jgi:D-serine dehydratase
MSSRAPADGTPYWRDVVAGRPASQLAAQVVRPMLSGEFTVEDESLFRHLHLAATTEGIRIEPSAVAGCSGPQLLCETAPGRDYLALHRLEPVMQKAVHIVWTTGGLFVPDEEYRRFFERGAALNQPGEKG